MLVSVPKVASSTYKICFGSIALKEKVIFDLTSLLRLLKEMESISTQ